MIAHLLKYVSYDRDLIAPPPTAVPSPTACSGPPGLRGRAQLAKERLGERDLPQFATLPTARHLSKDLDCPEDIRASLSSP